MIFNTFVFLGVLYLFFMLRQDMKNMTIDSRHNRFMMGVAVFMYLTNFPGLLVGIAVLALTGVFAFFILPGIPGTKKEGLGSGDTEMASWALLGFGTLNLIWAVLYLVCVAILRVLYGLVMRRAGVSKLPGTPIFLGAFILTAAIGYYLDMLAFGLI